MAGIAQSAARRVMLDKPGPVLGVGFCEFMMVSLGLNGQKGRGKIA